MGQEGRKVLCSEGFEGIFRKTKPLVSLHVKRLFLSPRDPNRPSSKNVIAYFIKLLVLQAHRELRHDMLSNLKV